MTHGPPRICVRKVASQDLRRSQDLACPRRGAVLGAILRRTGTTDTTPVLLRLPPPPLQRLPSTAAAGKRVSPAQPPASPYARLALKRGFLNTSFPFFHNRLLHEAHTYIASSSSSCCTT